MDALALLAIQVLVYAGFAIVLGVLASRATLTPLYAYIAAVLAFGGILGQVFSITVTDWLSLSSGSIAYGGLLFSTLVLVIVGRDVQVIRNVVVLVVAVDVFTVALFGSVSGALSSPSVANPLETPASLFSVSVPLVITGGVLIVVELLALIVVFGQISRRIGVRSIVPVLYVAAFVSILALDGVLFPLLSYPFAPFLIPGIPASVAGKLLIGAAYGVPLIAFLVVMRRRVAAFEAEPPVLRDLLRHSRVELVREIERQRGALDQATVDLRASEARYRGLLTQSPVAILVSLDGRIQFANTACLQLIGARHLDEIVGRSPDDLFPDVGQDSIREKTGSALVSGARLATVDRIRRLDGSLVDVEVVAARFEDHGSIGTHVVLQDITERKLAEAAILRLNDELEERVVERTAKLEAANRELATFSYSVSHDLRAPVRAITGFAEILDRRYRDRLDDKGAHYLDTILSSGTQMGVLIEELLDYSRLGHTAVGKDPVPLEPIIKRLATTFAARMGECGGTLEIVEPLAAPVGDPTLLEQILLNLLDNAITYRRPDVAPLVTISAIHRGARVTITVADNGIGIPAEHREKIFEVFERLHDEDEYPGTGIGLATVRKAATLMGTEVTLVSTPGEGSSFSVELPAASATDQPG